MTLVVHVLSSQVQIRVLCRNNTIILIKLTLLLFSMFFFFFNAITTYSNQHIDPDGRMRYFSSLLIQILELSTTFLCNLGNTGGKKRKKRKRLFVQIKSFSSIIPAW